MAFRFGDSFSHYATAQILQKWTVQVQPGSGSDCTIQATSGRTGAGALRVITGFLSQCYIQKTLDNQPTWTIGAAINLTIGKNFGLMFLLDGSTRQIGLAVNTNGTLYVEKNGTVLATSTATVATGWNYIELTATFNGGSGSLDVHLANTSVLTYSGNISRSGNDRANAICLGDWIGPSGNQTILYCDHYVNDGTGSINNTFWGDSKVIAQVSTSNGNYTSFSVVGAGSAHAAVSEIPPDGDTSYVASNTVSARESFVFPGVSGSILTARAIQTVLDVRKDAAGLREIAASLRISSTDYDGSTVSLSTQYIYYVEPREINPNTAVAWTTTTFAAGIEAGIEIVS